MQHNESEVLTFNALLARLGRRSRQSIYDLMRRDPMFPKPRQIGSEFSVGWLRGEVMEWLSCDRHALRHRVAVPHQCHFSAQVSAHGNGRSRIAEAEEYIGRRHLTAGC